jgi:predicted nucleotidyltransferase
MIMLEQLFSSAARAKVLTLLLLNAADRFYQRQIAELTGLPIRAVQREVERLTHIEVLQRTDEGNRAYYQVNRDSFLFPELKGLVLKTAGLARLLNKALADSDAVRLAFVYGSYASGQETAASDVDLFVVGTITGRQLSALLRTFRDTMGREVNAYLATPEEFRQKVQGHDSFVQNVLNNPKVFIVGDEETLRTLAT